MPYWLLFIGTLIGLIVVVGLAAGTLWSFVQAPLGYAIGKLIGFGIMAALLIGGVKLVDMLWQRISNDKSRLTAPHSPAGGRC